MSIQGVEANKNGTAFETQIKKMVYDCFSGKSTIETPKHQSTCFLERDDSVVLLKKANYLLTQVPYTKIDGGNGYFDIAWYSEDIPRGIAIESFSHTKHGSKDCRISQDVNHVLYQLSQKYKILVIGGGRRESLKKRARVVLDTIKHRTRKTATNVFIVTTEELPHLLEQIKAEII